MTDATLQHLLTRVEAATGPDRQLDADISRALGLTYRDDGVLGIGPGDDWPQAEFTNSIDTALALVGWLLPEYDWILGHTNGGLTIHCQIGPDREGATGFGETPTLAILAALLKALIVTDARP